MRRAMVAGRPGPALKLALPCLPAAISAMTDPGLGLQDAIFITRFTGWMDIYSRNPGANIDGGVGIGARRRLTNQRV